MAVVNILKVLFYFLIVVHPAAGHSESAGNQTNVTTIYPGGWTTKSPTFSRYAGQIEKHYYYDLLQVSVSLMGTYTFTSNSLTHTYGYLYNDEFKSTDPSFNLISQDDNSGGQGQFRITTILQPGHKYILIATTYNPETTGEFSILSSGPATIDIHSTIISTEFATAIASSNTRSITSTYSAVLSSSSPVFVRSRNKIGNYYYQTTQLSVATAGRYTFTRNSSIDTYDSTIAPFMSSTSLGTLSSLSPTFKRPGASAADFYYQAIRVTVHATGTYIFTSNSSMDTYGCVYNEPFDPYSPSSNLIISVDDGNGNGQFRMNVSLQSWRTYILVVTTFSSFKTGAFSVTVIGRGSASLISVKPPETSTPHVTTTTYSGSLAHSSPVFVRPPSNTNIADWYYQAIRVTIYTAGRYTFTNNSSMDTYGCFYNDSFDPSYPNFNLIIYNDDGGDGSQFLINVILQTGYSYILAVTTYGASVTGSFLIRAIGPGMASLISITPSTGRPIRTSTYRPCSILSSCNTDNSSATTKIMGITFVCVSAISLIIAVVVCLYKKITTPNQLTIARRNNQNERTLNSPLTSVYCNTPRLNAINVPYPMSMPAADETLGEAPPPSYDTYMKSLRTQH